MNILRITSATFRTGLLAAALSLGGASLIGAQDAAPAPAAASADAASSEDDMFGSPETVTQANNVSKEAEGQSSFLKYDQVKIGGSITGKLGFNSVWAPAWDTGSGSPASLFAPTSYYLSPDLEGKITLVAKPSTDFGVNMDFRTSWPFQSISKDSGGDTYSAPNISVWSLYSKFNWQDKVYFSFGKQPISWGVSKGYFQPADDIFALSAAIDPTNTGAEREGPVSLKTTVPMSVTNNLYFFAGLPSDSSGSPKVDPADARLAVKGEYGFANTELAAAAFYAYNDHPRGLLMATTGLGSWNLFGEGVLKYGSERYFVAKVAPSFTNPTGLVGAKAADKLYFTGTAGGYYMNSDDNVTISLSYMYNGEAQDGVSASETYTYFGMHADQIDRAKFSAHYGFASLSKSDILPSLLGSNKLAASVIGVANLSDLSGFVMPSLTWTFFDYISLQLGATFNWGADGTEFIVANPVSGFSLTGKPSAALNLTMTVGTGAF